ncbi:MAG: alpha/beta hydrolase-fold protein [Thermoguttaceae bacterium]
MWRTFVITSVLGVSIPAASIADAAGTWQDLCDAKTYKSAAGESLPYRLLKPEKIEPGKTYPLVLFLHGAGERGADNAKQLTHGAREFAKADVRRRHPCFVLTPQCPEGKRWVEVDWALPAHTMPAKPSVPMRLALELVDKLVGDLPIDKGRIYVTGLSMGGFGAWDAPLRRPGLFAAAMPVCGGGDLGQAAKFKDMPVWAFHGDHDHTVLPSRTTDMIEAIRKAGGHPKMTIYPGVDHDCWTATYANPKVLDWLFAQQKQQP